MTSVSPTSAVFGSGIGPAYVLQVIAERRRHVARPALHADGLEQAAEVPGRAAVEVQRVRGGLAGEREALLHALQLDRQRGGAADDAALGLGNHLRTTE